MGFSTERNDALWWLMISGDVNAARALLVLLDGAGLARRRAAPGARRARPPAARSLEHDDRERLGRARDGKVLRRVRDDAGLRSHGRRASARSAREVAWPADDAAASTRVPVAGAPPRRSRSRTRAPVVRGRSCESRAALPLDGAARSPATRSTHGRADRAAVAGRWTRGDVVRVRLEIDAQSDMSWVVVDDPVPAGATHPRQRSRRATRRSLTRRRAARRLGRGPRSRSAASTRSAPTTASCRRDASPSSTRCGSTTPARSCCRRRASRRCTRRRCSASCRTSALRGRAARMTAMSARRCASSRGCSRVDARRCASPHGARRSTPAFDGVRGEWRASDGYLLDRDGELARSRPRSTSTALRRPVGRRSTTSRPRCAAAVVGGEDQRFRAACRRRLARARVPRAMADAARRRPRAARARSRCRSRRWSSPAAPARRAVAALARQVRADARRLARSSARWTKDADPRGVPQPRELPRRAAGRRRRGARSLAGKAPSGLDRRRSPSCSRPRSPRRTPRAERVARRACAPRRARARGGRLRRARSAARSACSRGRTRRCQRRRSRRSSPRRLLREPGERVRTTLDAPLQRWRTRRAGAAARGARRAQRARRRGARASTTRPAKCSRTSARRARSSRARTSTACARCRQAGSTLKPFLYGLALERRYLTPASLLDDSPHQPRNGHRALPAAELRPRLQGRRQRAHRARAARSTCRRCARSMLVGVEASATGCASLGYDGPRSRRRVLRLLARARLRRSHAAGSR